MPAMDYHMPMLATHSHIGLVEAMTVVLVHTGAMLLVMGTVAIAVYQWIGLQILRSAWVNLDTIWAVALIAAGLLSLII
jgi:hypothetical protein